MIDCFQFFWLVRPKLRPGVCEVLEYKFLNFALTSPEENASIFIQRCHGGDLLVALFERLGAIHPQAFTVVKDE